jgi:hypothetical protein
MRPRVAEPCGAHLPQTGGHFQGGAVEGRWISPYVFASVTFASACQPGNGGSHSRQRQSRLGYGFQNSLIFRYGDMAWRRHNPCEGHGALDGTRKDPPGSNHSHASDTENRDISRAQRIALMLRYSIII